MKRTAKLKPIDAGNFAWDGIYEEYDEVIGRYAKWVLTQSENVDLVIDLHSAMNEELNKRRDADPDFSYSNDGVHFNAAGHRVVAGAILTALELEPKLTDDTDYLKQVSERQTILRDAWLEHCGHLRPGVPKGLPFKEALDKAKWIDANLRNGTTAAIP